jgi:hypothetical protein
MQKSNTLYDFDDQSSRHRPCRLRWTVRGKLKNSRILIRRERSLLLREAAVACSCTFLRGCTLQMALAFVHKAAAIQSRPKTVLSMRPRLTLLPLEAGIF